MTSAPEQKAKNFLVQLQDALPNGQEYYEPVEAMNAVFNFFFSVLARCGVSNANVSFGYFLNAVDFYNIPIERIDDDAYAYVYFRENPDWKLYRQQGPYSLTHGTFERGFGGIGQFVTWSKEGISFGINNPTDYQKIPRQHLPEAIASISAAKNNFTIK